MKIKKRTLWLLSGACAVILATVLGVVSALSASSGKPGLFSVSEINAELKDGDIVLRRGDGFWSAQLCSYSPEDKRYSHVGILRRIPDGFEVIHAEGNDFTGQGSVHSVPLQSFLDDALFFGIYRLKNADGKKIADAAHALCGRPFDWLFDLENSDKIYCTELVYLACQTAAPDIRFKEISLNSSGKPALPLDSIYQHDIATEVFLSARQP